MIGADALTNKIGPLPAWGWGVAIGGGVLAFRALSGRDIFPKGGSGSTSDSAAQQIGGGGTGALTEGELYAGGAGTIDPTEGELTPVPDPTPTYLYPVEPNDPVVQEPLSEHQRQTFPLHHNRFLAGRAQPIGSPLGQRPVSWFNPGIAPLSGIGYLPSAPHIQPITPPVSAVPRTRSPFLTNILPRISQTLQQFRANSRRAA